MKDWKELESEISDKGNRFTIITWR